MISVVIPAYNEEEYIEECLKCLMAQTRAPDEIIVVDNNSTDRTVEIASRFPVRIISEPRQGISYARNAGFDAAQYDVIARTDADSRPNIDWVERIAMHFAEADIQALVGPVCFYDSRIAREGSKVPHMYMKTMKKIMKGKEMMCGTNLAIRTSLWNTVRDYMIMDNRKVHEDVDLGIRIQRLGTTVVYDPELIMPSSSRRAKQKPLSQFGEYQVRFVRTLVIHSPVQEKLRSGAVKVAKPIGKGAVKVAVPIGKGAYKVSKPIRNVARPIRKLRSRRRLRYRGSLHPSHASE